jgi:hypothetical protein
MRPSTYSTYTVVARVTISCSLVGDYKYFGGTYYLHLRRKKMEALCSSETLLAAY